MTRIEHTTLRYPTVEWQGENPLPCLANDGFANTYPYNERDEVKDKIEFRDFEAYVFENEYLQATVCPELGCRLLRLFDKVAGRDVFAMPQTFRPSVIFLRGVFMPLGLELNFPQGHNVHSASYIPTEIAKLDNDGVGVTMHVFNAPSRIDHLITFALYPGERLLRHSITFFNTAPVRSGFMYWANAGVLNTPELKMQVRAKYSHYFDSYNTFPIIDGLDRRISKNRKQGSDLFAIGCDVDWFGFYAPEYRFGALHHADREKLPGKKLFSWGFDEFSRRWGRYFKLQTPEGYIEVQAGNPDTQMEHDFLAPFEQRTIDEVWQPFDELQGEVLHANDKIIVAGDCDYLQFIASVPLSNLKIMVNDSPYTLAGIYPGHYATITVPEDFSPECFNILIYAGNELILQHGIRPLVPASPLEIKAAQDWLRLPADSIVNNRELAWRDYKAHRFASARKKAESADCKELLTELDWWLANNNEFDAREPYDCGGEMIESVIVRAEAMVGKGEIAKAVALLPDNDFIAQIMVNYLTRRLQSVSLKTQRNPFCALERQALQWYIAAGLDNNGEAEYLLGNFFSNKDMDIAIALWKSVIKKNPAHMLAHRNTAYMLMNNNQPVDALRYYQKAIRPDCHPALFCEYMQAMRLNDRHAEALKILEKNIEPMNDYRTRKMLMELKRDVGDYEGALSVMDGGDFLVWEGETLSHRIYQECHIALGETALKNGNILTAERHFRALLETPEVLCKGISTYENQSAAYYFLGLCAEARMDLENATKYFKISCNADFPSPYHWMSFRENEYFAALAAGKLKDHTIRQNIIDRLLAMDKMPRHPIYFHYPSYGFELCSVRAYILLNDKKNFDRAMVKLAERTGKNSIYLRELERFDEIVNAIPHTGARAVMMVGELSVNNFFHYYQSSLEN